MADGLAQRRLGLLGLLLSVLVCVIVAAHVDVGLGLVDLFQEGEYLATNASVVSPPGGLYPLMTHGLIDYLPFEVARAICGDETTVTCTRALNDIMAALAMIVFVFTVDRLLVRAQHLRFPAAIGMCAFLLAYNGRAVVATDLHQGAPSLRDLFLLIDLLLIMALLRGGERRLLHRAAAACLGLTLPIAIFWAYNRGVASGVAVGLAVLFLLVQRRFVLAMICVSSAVVATAIGLALNASLFEQHVFNVIYWSRNSGIWAYPVSVTRLLLLAPFVAATFVACALALWRALRLFRAERGGEAGLLVVLAAVAVLVLLQSLGRSDNVHLAYMFPYLGILLACWRTAGLPPEGVVRPSTSYGRLIVMASLVVVMEFYSPYGSLVRDQLKGMQHNLGYVRNGLPRDKTLPDEDALAVAAVLRQSGETCTYSFDNSEAMYFISGIPSCSNFLAPVYAVPSEQSPIIARLDQEAPGVILFSSQDTWNAMDKRSLQDRTPELATWAIKNYPYSLVKGNYELRARVPFPQ